MPPTMVPGIFVNPQGNAYLSTHEPLCQEYVSSCPVDIFHPLRGEDGAGGR